MRRPDQWNPSVRRSEHDPNHRIRFARHTGKFITNTRGQVIGLFTLMLRNGQNPLSCGQATFCPNAVRWCGMALSSPTFLWGADRQALVCNEIARCFQKVRPDCTESGQLAFLLVVIVRRQWRPFVAKETLRLNPRGNSFEGQRHLS
jgi:hypothetical protein